MNVDFIRRCNYEIEDNELEKGNWKNWKPSKKELTKELAWHQAKLSAALLNSQEEFMREYAADVANLCEKVFTMSCTGFTKYTNDHSNEDYEDNRDIY